MATFKAIESLRQSVSKVGDDGLKSEILGRMRQLEDEIQSLQTRAPTTNISRETTIFNYNPPI